MQNWNLNMNIQDDIDELMRLCGEFNSDILNDNIQSIYPEVCNCEDASEILSFLSELQFLIDEVSDDDTKDLVYDIEAIIEEIQEKIGDI